MKLPRKYYYKIIFYFRIDILAIFNKNHIFIIFQHFRNYFNNKNCKINKRIVK